MLTSNELTSMDKAIAEIGSTNSCITKSVINDTKKILLDKGLDDAEIFAAQLTGTDQNTELSRVLKIFRKNNLSRETMVEILDKLSLIESGKW